MIPNQLKFEKYKSSIIYSLFFTILFVITYFLIIIKLLEIETLKNQESTLSLKNQKLESSLKLLDRNYENIKIDYKNIKEKALIQSEKIKNIAFKDISDFETFISNRLSENYLTLKTIARVETLKESEKVYVPYIFSGEYINIETFIKELENSDKEISFGDTPFLIKKEKNWTFNGKIATKILNIKTSDTTLSDNTLYLSSISTKKISQIHIIRLNGKKYALIKYYDNVKRCICDGDKIQIENETYTVKIINNKVILKK